MSHNDLSKNAYLQAEQVICSLRTQNLKVLVAFYTRLFGEPVHHNKTWSRFTLTDHRDGTALVIWEDKEAPNQSKASLQLCLQVPNLSQTVAALGNQFQCSPIQHASHGKEVFLKDPDGNELILYEPKKPSEIQTSSPA